MPTTGQEPDPQPSARRAELLAATLAYVAEHNLSDLSLRPLAAAIGSSPRVLIYLFGSKEQLIRDLLTAGRREQLALLERSGGQADTARERLEVLWRWLTAPDHRSMLRLFFEGYVRAFDRSGPWTDFATASLQEWLPPLEQVLAGHRVNTTVVLAVLRGLLMDLLADDAHAERVDRAWDSFLSGTFGPG